MSSEYWVGNQTMDEDTAAAYEQFVAESGTRLSNNSAQSQVPTSSHRCNGGWSYQQWPRLSHACAWKRIWPDILLNFLASGFVLKQKVLLPLFAVVVLVAPVAVALAEFVIWAVVTSCTFGLRKVETDFFLITLPNIYRFSKLWLSYSPLHYFVKWNVGSVCVQHMFLTGIVSSRSDS